METRQHGSWVTHTPQTEGKIEYKYMCVRMCVRQRNIQQQNNWDYTQAHHKSYTDITEFFL